MRLSSTKIIAQAEAGIGWLTFNNPEKRNAMGHDMRVAALEALSAFRDDPAIVAVVMKGAGDKAFMSGADISQFEPGEKGEAQRRHESETSETLRAAWAAFPKPLIAMIHGYCLGGGLMTAMAADIRIASDDAQFGIPAARLGIAYPLDATRNLVSLVGPAKAKEILFTGDRFDAQEALRIGLLNRIVPLEQLNEEVRRFAQTLSHNAPLSMRAAKITINHLLQNEAQRDAGDVQRAIDTCSASEDFAEGRRAFAQKRAPQFKGS